MPSNHLILCCPLLFLPSIFPSIRVFSNELALHVSRGNEYSGLISFRIDWLDILAVQGTLKSFLQHHNSKASVLLRSAFWMVQLSHPHMITGKTISLTFYDIKVVIWVSFLISLMAWWKIPGSWSQKNEIWFPVPLPSRCVTLSKSFNTFLPNQRSRKYRENQTVKLPKKIYLGI